MQKLAVDASRIWVMMVAKTFTWTFLIVSLAVVACYNNDKIYTNKWLVRIQGGIDQAEKLAQKYGFVNEGEVGT